MKTRIEELFCIAALDDDDVEGIPAFAYGDTTMPMVGADLERMESLKQIAANLQKQSGKKVRLYKFTAKEEIDWEKND